MIKSLITCALLVFAILLTAACTPARIDRPVPPEQLQPSATIVVKVVTLGPAAGQTDDPQATPTASNLAGDDTARETAIANLQALLNNPQLELTFKDLERSPNASYYQAGLFVDEQQNRYYISQDTLRPLEFTIEHPLTTEPGPAKTSDELRAQAFQIAADHSEKFETLQPNLKYEEGAKSGENYFYRWELAGSDVGGMPAILQIGLKQDGTLFSYLNSLDLQP